MARTSRQLAALGVTIALALSGSNASLSNGLAQDEFAPGSTGRSSSTETFGGNGRMCLTCHSKDTGTSPWPTCSGSSIRRTPTTNS